MSNDIKTIHLLLLEPSSNHAEKIINAIRNKGYAVRATQILGPEDLTIILEKQVSDLLLAVSDHSDLSAKQAIEQIAQFGRDIPTIIMFDELDEGKILEAYKDGACSTVSHDNMEMLCLLTEQEIRHLDTRRNKTQAELALRASEKRCTLLLDSSQDAIAYIHDGMHVYSNRAYLELFDYSDHDEIMCVPALDMIAKQNQEEFKQHLKEISTNNDQHNFTFSGARSDMSTFEAIMTLSPANYDNEVCTQILIRSANDNSELEEKLKEISSLDTLTDLYNKVYFVEQLEKAQERAVENACTYNLLYIEYDQHNQLKGEYGIAGVEKVTQETAKWLSDKVDDDFRLARLSDHSFGVLIEDKSSQKAKDLAEKLCKEVKPHLFDIEGHTAKITFSIGICPISDNNTKVDQYISDAHSAASRLENGDGYKVYNKALQNMGEEVDPVLVEKIQDAIEAGRIELLFQPIVKLHGEEKSLYQALLKLTDDKGNIISSDKVFPVARVAGLGVKLDKWIMTQALRSLRTSQQENEAQVFVHLSSVSLIDEKIVSYIEKTIIASKLDKRRLVFQFDESDAANHLKRVITLCAELKSKGMITCLSQFGANPEQITLIDQLDVDYVKISDSISDNLHTNAESAAHIQHLLDEIHNRDKQSIIPKVEEAAMLAALWPMNVRYIQGYYLQRPTLKMEYDFSSSGF
ncbi:MAG: EAL domain-containing protein [Kangiellaceae bacterium]|nr:EAL domain-containing protein [Kangiellaceae bacterium]